ncbi:hypothetical protein OH77DRAFT_1416292 [Trametes cingulata]|nr:hypothetical protein OH77DRAFT_1416292 [Trametes cingulata]
MIVISFVAAYVRGQTTNAECKNNSDTSWSFNSLGQTPCLMAAYIQGACQPDGKVMVQALPDAAFEYNGPAADAADACMCSSIAYALFSACGFCQGSGWPEWSQWTQHCNAQDVHNGSFPRPIPAGTAIPDWAFIAIDGFLDTFDAVGAERIGDKLESTGTAQPTGAAASQGSSTHSASLTGSNTIAGANGRGSQSPAATGPPAPASSSSSGSSSDTGGIVGGVIGGLVGFAILAGLAVYFCILRGRRGRAMVARKPRRTRRAAVPVVDVHSSKIHPSDDPELATEKEATTLDAVDSLPSVAHTPSRGIAESTPMRLYDPEDPSTFPPTPAPFAASIHTQLNTALGTYPNASSVTREDTLPRSARSPPSRTPVPEL